MLFNSISFLIFFIVVTPIYFLFPHKYRWFHLLAASCLFYMAFIPVYILILGFTIVMDYFVGIMLEKIIGKKRKLFLVLSIIANMGVLAVFKYYNFFIENITTIAQSFHLPSPISHLPFLNIILPIGLSFHTFQALSYTIEVYRGNQKAEKHFGIYALYVMFYPQLVAGPIERPQNMLHQFHEKKNFNFNNAIVGIQQMLWGLFKKVVVSDLLATYVNSIYNHYEVNTGFTLLFATYAFAIQIYCDFSGYSDIALGSAKVMGFNLMENFSLPYFSKSVTEFWRRWHISLSTWLRDYLYISMGGNQKGKLNTYKNLMLTMLLGGLWHGASWNFVIWGFLNGFYLSVEKILGINFNKSHQLNFFKKCVRVFITFNLISLTWIFFRATTFEQSIFIIQNIFDFHNFFHLRIQDTGVFAAMIFGLILMLFFEYFYLRKNKIDAINTQKNWLKPIVFITTLILIIVLFGVSKGDQFIYFQF